MTLESEQGIPTVSASLESLNELDKDRDFLKAGGVFSDNLIDALHISENGRGSYN